MYKYFIRCMIYKNFLQFRGLSFQFHDVITWSTKLFHLDDVQFVFSFVAHAFGVLPK
jgi:hypothetical protein